MLEKLKSEEGAKEYKKRKAVVEPVFGQMKWARGFRQFSMRGLEKARGEFALLCTAHNILKIWRYLKGSSCEGNEFAWLYNYFWLVCLFYVLRNREIFLCRSFRLESGEFGFLDG